VRDGQALVSSKATLEPYGPISMPDRLIFVRSKATLVPINRATLVHDKSTLMTNGAILTRGKLFSSNACQINFGT
jgi:hypothetical protein